MKVVLYGYEHMQRAGALLNKLHVSGVDNVRILAELSYIIDSGKIKDRDERKDGKPADPERGGGDDAG